MRLIVLFLQCGESKHREADDLGEKAQVYEAEKRVSDREEQ